jgi:hypothetical protein
VYNFAFGKFIIAICAQPSVIDVMGNKELEGKFAEGLNTNKFNLSGGSTQSAISRSSMSYRQIAFFDTKP